MTAGSTPKRIRRTLPSRLMEAVPLTLSSAPTFYRAQAGSGQTGAFLTEDSQSVYWSQFAPTTSCPTADYLCAQKVMRLAKP